MPFERILVAIDGSDGSRRALSTAIELAGRLDAHLFALAVEGPLPVYAATIGEVDEVQREKDAYFGGVADEARRQAAAADIELEVTVRPGHAADLIVRHARERRADLIVVGHRGHVLGDYLLGSIADRVAHHADCPVMIVR